MFPQALLLSASFVPSSSDHFHVPPDDPFDPGFPDSVLRDLEAPIPPSVPDSYCAEMRRMLSYLIDLLPQAAGSPSVAPPPIALFEDFFSPASAPPLPIHLNWFERVRTALSDVDSRLAAFLASGRPYFSFLISRLSTYAVRGDFALGCTAPVNPSLLALFEHPLHPVFSWGSPFARLWP